jgi:hypothetical protein
MRKVAPNARLRVEPDGVLAGVTDDEDPIEKVGRLGARFISTKGIQHSHGGSRQIARRAKRQRQLNG